MSKTLNTDPARRFGANSGLKQIQWLFELCAKHA